MTKKSEQRSLAIITHILGWLTGFLGPLIVYLVSEDKYVKTHSGKALNWQISLIIYSIVSFVLVIILVGFLFLAVLGILNIVFSIIAAVKASNNELWDYPLSIPFFKV